MNKQGENVNIQELIDSETEQKPKIMNKEDLIEALAENHHKIWITWSQTLSFTEKLSKTRLERWKTMWVPYSELTEEQKEQDRTYARKTLEIIEAQK